MKKVTDLLNKENLNAKEIKALFFKARGKDLTSMLTIAMYFEKGEKGFELNLIEAKRYYLKTIVLAAQLLRAQKSEVKIDRLHILSYISIASLSLKYMECEPTNQPKLTKYMQNKHLDKTRTTRINVRLCINQLQALKKIHGKMSIFEKEMCIDSLKTCSIDYIKKNFSLFKNSLDKLPEDLRHVFFEDNSVDSLYKSKKRKRTECEDIESNEPSLKKICLEEHKTASLLKDEINNSIATLGFADTHFKLGEDGTLFSDDISLPEKLKDVYGIETDLLEFRTYPPTGDQNCCCIFLENITNFRNLLCSKQEQQETLSI